METPFSKALAKAQPHASSASYARQGSGRIITAGDGKVCQACKNAAKYGTPLPPEHPRCRCRTVQTA